MQLISTGGIIVCASSQDHVPEAYAATGNAYCHNNLIFTSMGTVLPFMSLPKIPMNCLSCIALP